MTEFIKKEINTEQLIKRFEDMANRGSLLTGNVSQEDLLMQIIGAIVKEAIEEKKKENECEKENTYV